MTESTNPSMSPEAQPVVTPNARPSLFRRLGPTGILAIVAIAIPIAVVPFLAAHLDLLKRAREALNSSAIGPVLCVLIFTVGGGLTILPTITMSLFAGWAFGFLLGFPIVILGFGGAAWLNYLIARRTAGRNVVETIECNPRWCAIHRALLGGGELKTFLIVALLRLPTFPPFGATTIALAAMHVRIRPFVLGTMVGAMPRTALYVWLASRLQPDKFDPSAGGDWVTLVISGVATVAVLAVITIIGRRALKRLTTEQTA